MAGSTLGEQHITDPQLACFGPCDMIAGLHGSGMRADLRQAGTPP